FDFEYIEPYDPGFAKSVMQEWVNSFSAVYVQTVPGANLKTIEKNINEIIKKHNPTDKVSTYFAFPMSKWHLQSDFKNGVNVGGMIEYVKLFSIIAIIILIIACINFMNLSTARSEKKAKEVGIRKTLGSGKKQLITQFFCESMLFTLIACTLSVLFVYLLLPSFNSLTGKQLGPEILQPFFWIGVFSIMIFTGFISGSYPALYLSSFNPIAVLKGNMLSGKKALLPRRILVTSQFVISILLISATIIVYQQIQHVKNRASGYDSENLVMIPSTEDLNRNFSVVKEELLKTGAIDAVTRTSSPLTEVWWSSPGPDCIGKPAKGQIVFTGLTTDADFTKTLGIKILHGKDFSGMPADSSCMLLNKTAVEVMGLKNPVGMQMRYANTIYTVKGVVDDIVMESPFKPVSPLMIYYDDKSSGFINLRLNQAIPAHQSIKYAEAIIKKYNPSYPFEYEFVNEVYNRKFISEELISKLTTIFASLAIFICCIGLAGLTAFTIEKRTRELGVRKVLGASLTQLAKLISREFIQLVSIAFVITIPLTWILMNKWLQNYSFHISINVWVFIAVGFLVLALTLIIVFLNILRTGNKNPIKSLRNE
ncbi:MAG: FtsX-like permease family protein, partial [Bacteroidia bacterium]|nr:FtsX-like permease family protein [Bacteroidia bacterium]